MDRVIVNPVDVRGLGDVVSPKSTNDFCDYNSITVSSTDSTYGTVYTDSYRAGSSLSVSADTVIGSATESFTVSATLKDHSDVVISGATVHFVVNDVDTAVTTNGSGVASLTVTCDGSSVYRVKVYYIGNSNDGGCFANHSVYVADVGNVDLDLFVEKPVIQTGDHDNLIVRLHDGSRGIPNQTVYFYEEYEPTTLLLSSDKSIIQTGEQANLQATLKDVDGSGIEGETVKFYKELTNVLWYDECINDQSSSYVPETCEGGTKGTISYNEDHYTLTGGQYTTTYLVTEIGKVNEVEITLKCKPTSTSFSGAIGIAFQESEGNVVGLIAYTNGDLRKVAYIGGEWKEEYSQYYNNALTFDSDGYCTINAHMVDGVVYCGEIEFELHSAMSEENYIGIMKGTGTLDFNVLIIEREV